MTSWEYRFPESDVRHRRRKILFNRFLKVLLKVFFFFKNGPIPVSFCLFPPISLYNFNNTNWKKLRLCAWDSNPRPQDGKRRWIHGAMVAAKRSSLSSFHKMGQIEELGDDEVGVCPVCHKTTESKWVLVWLRPLTIWNFLRVMHSGFPRGCRYAWQDHTKGFIQIWQLLI